MGIGGGVHEGAIPRHTCPYGCIDAGLRAEGGREIPDMQMSALRVIHKIFVTYHKDKAIQSPTMKWHNYS